MSAQNHLNSCVHREDAAWCLECVKEEWERRDKIERLLKNEVALNTEREERYLEEIIRLKADLWDMMAKINK